MQEGSTAKKCDSSDLGTIAQANSANSKGGDLTISNVSRDTSGRLSSHGTCRDPVVVAGSSLYTVHHARDSGDQ